MSVNLDGFPKASNFTTHHTLDDAADQVVPRVITVQKMAGYDCSQLSDGQVFIARGLNAEGDGGGGQFVYRPYVTTTADGTDILTPAGGTGRVLRVGLSDAQAALVGDRLSTSAIIRTGNQGIYGWHGNALSTGTRSVTETTSIKLEAEADFDGVALAWVNYEAGAVAGCKAVVAATGTFATSSQAVRYQPNVAGTAYNALRGSSNAYGWDAITWAGASTVTLAAAGSYSAATIAVSDFAPIVSVARDDGGTRPALLIRAYAPGATNAYTYESRNFNASYNTANANNRGRLIDTALVAGDAIATLGTAFAADTKTPLVVPIFRYRKGVITVAAVGDSITQGTGSASGLDSWHRRACFDASTSSVPVVPLNLGFPSQTSATYLAAAKTILAAAKPSIAFYSPYSPNDSVNSTRSVQNATSRTAEFVMFCRQNGIIPILWTGIPDGNLTPTNDAFRRSINDYVRSMGASGAALVADFSAVMTDGLTPEGRLLAYYSDTLHPNDAGYDRIALVALSAINTAINLL